MSTFQIINKVEHGINLIPSKLNGVAPINNRPSTNQLPQFFQGKKIIMTASMVWEWGCFEDIFTKDHRINESRNQSMKRCLKNSPGYTGSVQYDINKCQFILIECKKKKKNLLDSHRRTITSGRGSNH